MEKRLGWLLAELGKAHLLPPGVGEEQIKQLFYVYKANVLAMLSYRPTAYAGEISLLMAMEQPVNSDRRGGWSKQVVRNLTIQTLPGNHYSLLRHPHVQAVATLLKILFASATDDLAEKRGEGF